MGRTICLRLGQSNFEKNTQFGNGPVTLWEEHSVWNGTSHTVGKTLGLGLGRSFCGKNTSWVCLRIRLGKTLGPKKEQVTGDWRKLQNEELHALYCSPNTLQVTKFKKDEMRRAFGLYGRQKKCIQYFGAEIRRKVKSRK